MKTIFYSVSTGYFARNLLKAGVIEKLLEHDDLRIVMITPGFNDEEFKADIPNMYGRVTFEKMHEINLPDGLLDQIKWKVWQLARGFHPIKPIFDLLTDFGIHRYLSRCKGLYSDIFDKYRPCLLITATPGFYSKLDIPVILEAQKREVKSLCLIHSWDNIVGFKGPFPTRPDILGVWSELQKREAQHIHFYEEDRIKVLGPPHFDVYQDPATFWPRKEFFRKMNLDEEKKLISVLLGNDGFGTDNSYIIDAVLDGLRQNEYTYPAQVLVRPHPRNSPERNREMYGRFYNCPDITIDHQIQYSQRLKWIPNKEQVVRLANTIKHSDVVVNLASTTTIEASIMDVPVVNVGFCDVDGISAHFQRKIMGMSWKFSYRYVLERNCVYMAKDREDLIKGINQYIKDPSVHREGRKRLARDICYMLDGKAHERIANYIYELTQK
jgi:hypothetical protein